MEFSSITRREFVRLSAGTVAAGTLLDPLAQAKKFKTGEPSVFRHCSRRKDRQASRLHEQEQPELHGLSLLPSPDRRRVLGNVQEWV